MRLLSLPPGDLPTLLDLGAVRALSSMVHVVGSEMK
jgi:hypothetical protein